MGSLTSFSKSSNDKDCISQALDSIIKNEGVDILNNPKKVKAFLSDHCAGDYKREIIIIERLLDDHVHDDLLRQKETTPYEILRTNIIKRICANHPLDETLVESGTDTLAIVLGVIKKTLPLNLPKKSTQPHQKNVLSQQNVSQQDFNALISQAMRFNQLKSFQEAVPLLTRVLENDPENAIALREKGFAISNLGRYEEAIEWYEKSIGTNFNDSLTWTYKGYALSKIRKRREAIRCYDTAISLDSNNATAWRNKGYSLEKMHDTDSASKCYQRSLDINPDDPITWNLLGWVIRDYYEKLRMFDKALSLDPNFIHAMINKGWVLSKLGKFQEALNLFERVLAIDKNNQKAWKERGFCLKMIREQNYKKPYPAKLPAQPPRAPTPENRGILDKIKGFFK